MTGPNPTMNHAFVRNPPMTQRGASYRRLLAAIGIWLALAVIAAVWWKPWEQHPNARRAAEAEAARDSASTASATDPAISAPPLGVTSAAISPPASVAPTAPDAGAPPVATADGLTPAELPDARTLLRGSHVKLARVTEGNAEELESGVTVARGDRLRFGLLLPYRMHVYAFNQEAGAATTVMFPLDALAHENPLPAGNNELPGLLNGQDASYEVMARGASEEILMVLALEPSAFLEAKLSEFAEVAEGNAAPPAAAGDLSIDALARALEPAAENNELRVVRWTLKHAP
jgi:hypothetical protein